MRSAPAGRHGDVAADHVVVGGQSQLQPQYWNPRSFQIISAGPDKAFGPGGIPDVNGVPALWGPGNPAVGAGEDDLSNFHDARLGTP